MNILRLKYLIAVVEQESFSAAAETLFTSQSAVSKQIIALENDLNVQIFDRRFKKAALTQQGKIVFEYAKKTIADYNDMIAAISEFEQYRRGSLTIAAIPVMAQYNITGILAAFRRKYPGINMIVDECEGQDILPALEHRQYEMAFMRGDVLDKELYDCIDIFTDRFVAVVSKDHPLALCESIGIEELKDEQFLLLSKRTLLYDSCIAACEKKGFTPTVSYTGTRMENIVELVAKDVGISLMMEKAVSYIHNDDICLVPLNEDFTSTISLVRNAKHKITSIGIGFWEFVKNR